MTESHTLSDLKAEYAEFVGELRQIEQRAEQRRALGRIANTSLIPY
jgi:hypothetical protein